MKKIAVNGFGRIGKCVTRALLGSNQLTVVNSNKLSQQNAAYMLQYDSTHGRLDKDVGYDSDSIIYGDHKIKISHETNIDNINWDGIDIVLECSGVFNSKAQSYKHIERGAKSVIVSAPCEGADYTVILGVNQIPDSINGKVISVGSCTTNALANIVKPLHNAFTITSAFMTTVHAYTNDQSLLDSRHTDLRRGRAAESSIIPTSTGAAKMIGDIIPELKGKIDGIAVRVPVQNVSMIDLTFTAEKSPAENDINQLMKEASQEIPDILGYCEKPLVSIDFNHTKYSAIFDGTQTKVINNKLFRVVAWYDNEWGFTNRMVDICNSF
jgi:glyceraldehyde 3-phosphate dehydrogenase